MKMNDLEKNLYQVRRQINDAIIQLAATALEDSSTYEEAIEKLKDFRWKLTGATSNFMIDEAIEIVIRKAMKSQI